MKRLLLGFFWFASIVIYAQPGIEWSVTNNDSYHRRTFIDQAGNAISIGITPSADANTLVTKRNPDHGTILWSTEVRGINSFNPWGFSHRGIVSDDENNIYITTFWTDEHGKNLCRLTKITANGVVQWAADYLNSDIHNTPIGLNSLAVDSKKNVYLCGVDVNGHGSGVYGRFLLVKYNSSGSLEWKKTMESSHIQNEWERNGIALCVAIDGQDNVIVTGSLRRQPPGFYARELVLYKFNGEGQLQWKVEKDVTGDLPLQLEIDPYNNIILLTKFYNARSGEITKYSPAGVKMFSTPYATGFVNIHGIAAVPELLVGSNGDFFLITSVDTGVRSSGFCTKKISSSGNLLWTRTHVPEVQEDTYNVPSDAGFDGKGNLVITGVSFRLEQDVPFYSPVDVKAQTVKYSGSGDELWQATIPDEFSIDLPPSVAAKNNYTFIGIARNDPGTTLTKYNESPATLLAVGCTAGAKGTDVVVPIIVRNFHDVVSAQFTVSWNPAVAEFKGIESFAFAEDEASSFGLSRTNEGMLTFAWFDTDLNARSLPDDGTLFAIKLEIIGNFAETSVVAIVNEPASIEIVKASNEQFQVSWVETDPCIVAVDALTLSGKISYASTNQSLPGVVMSVKGSDNQSVDVDQNGRYQFVIPSHTPDASYVLSAHKSEEIDKMSGIDVQDVALMRRHILQVQPLTTPYAIIAADVNRSWSVTLLDIVLLQSAILEIGDWFPTPLWVFIPADHVFDDDQNPFPYPTNKLVGNVEETFLSQDFIGIKSGDVTQDYPANGGRRKKIDDLIFEVAMPESAVNENKIIPIKVHQFKDVSAYQFTLQWNPDSISYISMSEKHASIAINEANVHKGFLSVIWDSPDGTEVSLEDGSPLLHMAFKRNIAGGRPSFKLAENKLRPLAFNKDLDRLNLSLRSTPPSIEGDGLTVYPNPFRNAVSIDIVVPSAGAVKLEIVTITGIPVKTHTVFVEPGRTVIAWDGTDDSGKAVQDGVYILNVRTANTGYQTKLIKQ